MTDATRDLLEQHFDTAFAAPDGIAKLRELILTLAMQGKLVEQAPADQPASELLKDIDAEKQRLVKAGKIKAPKPLPPIKPEEVPYQLPQGWEWVRLGGIASYIQRGKGPTYTDFSTHQVISQKCVRWYGLDLEPARYIAPESLQKYEAIRFLRAGDLLWNSTGTGTIGRACLVPENLENHEIVVDSHVTVVRPVLISPLFLWRWIQSPIVQDGVEASASGTTNQIELNTSTVINHLMPLPPLPEQYRIVAKIDQLMARCDALEKLQNECEEKRLATHAAAISQLLDTTGNRSADDAWAFITQHFGDLYSVKENVAELRKAILELAMRGGLSKSESSDEPLDALLTRLQEEQKANRSIGQKDKELIAERLAMASHEVKNNRVSLTARDFCEFITKGTTPAADELSERGDVPFLKVYNIVNNKIDFAYKPSYISNEVHYSKLKRSIVYPGDVIMNIVGPPLGKVAVVDDLYPEWNINQALAVFRPMAGILNQYIYYALSTHSVLGSTLREVKGTAGQDNLSLEQCRDLIISIPSIEEQHRIVDSIRQLMALCDTLDQKIDAAKSKRTEFLDALMAQV